MTLQAIADVKLGDRVRVVFRHAGLTLSADGTRVASHRYEVEGIVTTLSRTLIRLVLPSGGWRQVALRDVAEVWLLDPPAETQG